jgi:hypothetical protein
MQRVPPCTPTLLNKQVVDCFNSSRQRIVAVSAGEHLELLKRYNARLVQEVDKLITSRFQV